MRGLANWLPAVTLAMAMAAAPAEAATIRVTSCASDVAGGGQNLRDALQRGGEIIFDCPGGSATIRMTMGHVLPANTSIDGGDRIILDAEGRALELLVVPDGDFTARNITITNVRARRPLQGRRFYPSVLQVRSGTATLDNVTIRNSELAVVADNAKVSHSRFSRNTITALEVSEKVELSDTSFRGNAVALTMAGGSLRGNSFAENTIAAVRIIYPNWPVEIIDNYFHDNTGDGAVVISQRSNSSNGSQLISFSSNTFEDNRSEQRGGAITIYDTVTGSGSAQQLIRFPPSRFEFSYDKFLRNSGGGAGAIFADLFNTEGMRIVGGIFVGNEATGGRGGAISWSSASVALSHSAFIGNRAAAGAAIHTGSLADADRWQIANSIFTRNVAGPGGGVIETGRMELTNVTIARNDAIGFVGDQHGSPPELPMVANSILSENSQGNCRGINPERFLGRNVQFGGDDCPSVPQLDPLLDQLLIPQLGGPALTMGDLAICLADPVGAEDLLFRRRGAAGVCALGAFEYAPRDQVGAMAGEDR